jgi:7-cyano-7-deazaguanine synthase
LGLDAGMSHSCYDPQPDGRHCGRCDACRLRAKGFEEAGLPDPTAYA